MEAMADLWIDEDCISSIELKRIVGPVEGQ